MPEKIHINRMFDIADKLQKALIKNDDSIQQESLTESTYEIRLNKAEELFQELVPKDQYPHVDNIRSSSDEKLDESLYKKPHFLQSTDKTWEEWTLLHVAADRDYVELCDFLLKKGANIEAKNSLFDSPLNITAKTNAARVAKFLLSQGADIESKAKYLTKHKRLTHTPLIRACGVGGHCLEVIKVLLEHNADPKAMTIRNLLWDENIEPYHTTLHILISNSRKSKTEKEKERLLEAVKAILEAIPRSERKEFLERKTRYAEDPSMSELTTIEFANHYLKLSDKNDRSEFEYWRKLLNILCEYGANTSVLNDKCDIKRRRHISLEKDVKEIKQKVVKSTFEKIVEYTSLVLGLTTGMFAIYELLFNEKKSKRFCLTCACVTTGLLLIFGLCKMFPSTQLTDPQVEEQTKQEENQIS